MSHWQVYPLNTHQKGFVVADSTIELEIKDVDLQDGLDFTTEKNLLMDQSESSWAIRVEQKQNYTCFYVKLYDAPEAVKNCNAVFFVSCGDKNFTTIYSLCGLSDSRIGNSISDLKTYSRFNSIVLKFRLLINCDKDRLKIEDFYNQQDVRNYIFGGVANMFGDPTFADFTFVVEDREFKVHMNILAAASPVMRRMFTGDLEEARTKTCTVDDITAETFDQLLRFIYRGEVPIGFKGFLKPLYEAAHFYQIEKLKKISARKINKDLSLENALEVFEWVQIYDDFKQLKLDAWAIVKRDILKISVKLRNEPLTMKQVRAVIKQRKQEKAFWQKL